MFSTSKPQSTRLSVTSAGSGRPGHPNGRRYGEGSPTR
jgi:hypothetical protein